MGAEAQDALRPLRAFVGALGGAAAGYYDQTYAGQDFYAASWPGRYQSIGQYGYAIEGLPIAATPGGGVVLSPAVVMLGLGVALALFWKR